MAARTIDHVGILVRNADAAIRYLADTFHMPLVSDERLPVAGIRLAYVDAGPILLQIVEPAADGPLWEDLERFGEGLHHLCFAVSDLDATIAGLAPERQDAIRMGGRGRRTVFLPAQPYGLRIELTEREPIDRSDEVDV
ncbi:MAG TPA: VOC family protein [Thermomicrobiales bacterium]|jgi:catechol 2,3-dioxygenase-like lactoylglutathione lyase family enzyme|nr:VOC family protein [Thermomicrobiales bacterium]